MERQFKRRGESPPRDEAALEEIRRLFARYRTHPRRPAERTQRPQREEARRDADALADRPASPASP